MKMSAVNTVLNVRQYWRAQCAAPPQARVYPQTDQRGETGRESGQGASDHDASFGIKDFQLQPPA